jgi:hypothetical protein
MSDGWWRTHIPEGEEVLWTGQPHQGFFPPHVGWAYRILILSLGLAWLASPWFADTLRDYWKLIGSTGFVAFLMWYDRLLRTSRIYVVTTRNAWWISKIFKPKHIPVDRALNYHRSGQNVVFSRRLFLVFEYLSDPDAALAALNQAREASA